MYKETRSKVLIAMSTALALGHSAQAAGLVGHWSFDENAGTSVNDSAGSADLSFFGSPAPAWVPGVAGSALYFGGTSRAETASLPLGPTGPLTVSFWFNTTSWDAPWPNGVLLTIGDQRPVHASCAPDGRGARGLDLGGSGLPRPHQRADLVGALAPDGGLSGVLVRRRAPVDAVERHVGAAHTDAEDGASRELGGEEPGVPPPVVARQTDPDIVVRWQLDPGEFERLMPLHRGRAGA